MIFIIWIIHSQLWLRSRNSVKRDLERTDVNSREWRGRQKIAIFEKDKLNDVAPIPQGTRVKNKRAMFNNDHHLISILVPLKREPRLVLV